MQMQAHNLFCLESKVCVSDQVTALGQLATGLSSPQPGGRPRSLPPPATPIIT